MRSTVEVPKFASGIKPSTHESATVPRLSAANADVGATIEGATTAARMAAAKVSRR
jgi:hypothetical protein